MKFIYEKEFVTTNSSSSVEIYKNLAEHFKWPKQQLEMKGALPILFLENFNGKDMDIWFISYTDDDSYEDDGWKNIVSDDKELIVEANLNVISRKPDILVVNKRVVFLKEQNVYKFIGIFECIKQASNDSIRVYKRLSKTYSDE